jgi:hypothetical protein
VRFFALTPFALALAAGGVALAQPAALVDPWNSAPNSDSWFGSEPAPVVPAGATEIIDPWATEVAAEPPLPVAAASPAPKRAEVALGPAMPVLAVASGLEQKNGIVDPWAPPFAATETPALRAPERARSASWAEPFVEVADPWQQKPARATSEHVRGIVDPWAR